MAPWKGSIIFPLYFFLDKKVPKSQDCACFAQKTYVQKAKTPKLAASQLKQWVFFDAFLSCFLAHQSRSICGWLKQLPSRTSGNKCSQWLILGAGGWGSVPVAEVLEATLYFSLSEEVHLQVNGHPATIQELPSSPWKGNIPQPNGNALGNE